MKSKKKFLSIFAILFALVFALSVCFFAACGSKDDDEKGSDPTIEQGGDTSGDDDDEPGSETKPSTATVLSVSVAPATLDLVVGGEDDTLTATVTMSDASAYNGGYTWTSDDTSVATVTGSGATATVKAVKEGVADITVTLDDGESAACVVTVSGPEPEITTVTTAEELEAALEVGGYIELGADITGMFAVATDVAVTLDLKGYSITDLGEDDQKTGDTRYTITVENNASLTVKDSGAVEEVGEDDNASDVTGIICTYPASSSTDSRLGAAIYTRGILNIESGTLASSSAGIMAESGTTTITGGLVTSEYYTIFEAHGETVVNVGGGAVIHGTRGIFVSGDSYFGYGASGDPASYDFDAKNYLNIYGDAEVSTTFGSPVSTLGYTNRDTAYINISGGTISGRPIEYSGEDGATEKVTVMPAVYIPNGNLTVSGGTIEGSTAVEFRGGNVTITGGTLESTSEQPNDPQWNGSGATSYGYALAVYPYAKEGEKNEIEGRTFENALVVEVSGGTFIGPVCERNVNEELEYTFDITGGYFSEDPSSCLNDGYKAEFNTTSGYYEIVVDSTGAGGDEEEEGTVLTYKMANYFTYDSDVTDNNNLTNGTYYIFGDEGVTTGTAASGILSYVAGSGSKIVNNSAALEDGEEEFGVGIQNGGGAGTSGGNKRYYIVDLSDYEGQEATITVYATTNSDGNARSVIIGASVSTSLATAGETNTQSGVISPISSDVTCGTSPLYIFSDSDMRVYQIIITIAG